MSTELRPTTGVELRWWRLNALLAWLATFPSHDAMTIFARVVEAEKKAYEDKLDPDTNISDYRYVVVTVTYYDTNLDSWDYWGHDTLEKCKTEVEVHVFEPQREDYSVEAVVFDTNLRKQLMFKEIQTIEWEI